MQAYAVRAPSLDLAPFTLEALDAEAAVRAAADILYNTRPFTRATVEVEEVATGQVARFLLLGSTTWEVRHAPDLP